MKFPGNASTKASQCIATCNNGAPLYCAEAFSWNLLSLLCHLFLILCIFFFFNHKSIYQIFWTIKKNISILLKRGQTNFQALLGLVLNLKCIEISFSPFFIIYFVILFMPKIILKKLDLKIVIKQLFLFYFLKSPLDKKKCKNIFFKIFFDMWKYVKVLTP